MHNSDNDKQLSLPLERTGHPSSGARAARRNRDHWWPSPARDPTSHVPLPRPHRPAVRRIRLADLDVSHVHRSDSVPSKTRSLRSGGDPSAEALTIGALRMQMAAWPPVVREAPRGARWRVVANEHTVRVLAGRVDPDTVIMCIEDPSPLPPQVSLDAYFVLHSLRGLTRTSLALLARHVGSSALDYILTHTAGHRQLAPLLARLTGTSEKTIRKHLSQSTDSAHGGR